MGNSFDLTQLLQEMGFSQLEAEIYRYLLHHSPATGYKVAKGIGRSFTNTYKVVEALRAKGAVLVEEGTSRLMRAVPVEELLDQLEARFQQNRTLVIAAAQGLPATSDDNRIYHLTSVDQVYERFRQMLGECDERALGELSPEPYEILREAVEAAGARGLKIAVRTYQGETFANVRTVHSPIGDRTLAALQSQWVSLFVDGRQFLIANLMPGGGGVLEAIWSANMYLARQVYAFVNADLFHYAFAPLLEVATSVAELRAEYARLEHEFPPGGDLGFADLTAQFIREQNPSSPASEGV